MPDSEGKLTEEEFEKVKAWMARFVATDRPCSVCGTKGWTMLPRLVQPVTLGGAFVIQLGGLEGYPNVGLVCNTCGYTRYLNAVIMGIVPPGNKPG